MQGVARRQIRNYLDIDTHALTPLPELADANFSWLFALLQQHGRMQDHERFKSRLMEREARFAPESPVTGH